MERHPHLQEGDIEFEILETSALEEISYVTHIIQKTKKLGIDFSLDDFGTGYSSLTYLKRLPVKALKIDCGFVLDILDDEDDLAIVEGIIELSKTFKRDVIAEGVESVAHGVKLLELGCTLAQGYCIAKPMSGSDLLLWLKEWQAPQEWLAFSKKIE